MGRPHRAAEAGYVYHVLNRSNARMTIFEDDGDYEAFEEVLSQAVERTQTRLLAYCLMPNHWHLVVWPREDGELSRFVGWLTLTHTQRWHAHRHSAGSGHVYQGRFKSFPIQQDEHVYTVTRYVERNAPAGEVDAAGGAADRGLLASWPLPRKSGWAEFVNAPQTEAELRAARRSVQRGNPIGDDSWSERTVHRMGLESSLRARGRPKK